MSDRYEIFGSLEASHVFIQYVDDHDLSGMEKEIAEAQKILGHSDFCIVAIKVQQWFSQLPPWAAAPVFGKDPFEGGGPETLRILLDDILPELKQKAGMKKHSYYLCGYSLAGLFALWGSYQTPVFSGVLAASPSVWYPDWIEFARSHPIQTPMVYLSLGLKEEKARNKVMATVGDCIRTMEKMMIEKQITCILEWNQGNHFVDSEIRMAKGIAWLLQNTEKQGKLREE